MTTKRTLLSHLRKLTITEEMLALFARSCELQAEGHDSVDDKGPKHDEFRKIDKQLSICANNRRTRSSVFDDMLDRKQPPSYLRQYASGGPDWYESQGLRRAPLQELERRQRIA